MRRTRRVLAIMLAVLLLPAGAALAQDVRAQDVQAHDVPVQDVQVEAAEPTPAALAEAQFLSLVNQTRLSVGAQPVVVNHELADIARAWSVQMDADDLLHHNPSYAEQYTGEWRAMAENVGVMRWPGGELDVMVERLHQAFLDSPGHYRNLVGPDYNQVGIGVVLDDAQLWVTVNFLNGPVPAAPDEGAPPPATREAGSPTPLRYYVRG